MEAELSTESRTEKLNLLKNASAAAFTLLFATFIAITIAFQYTTYQELNKTKDIQNQKELEKTAVALSYFLAERKNDLRELISSGYLTTYYENKALGMSFKYGLKTSLHAINEKFIWLIMEKNFNKQPIYTRLQLTNSEGRCIVDTDEKDIFPEKECVFKKIIFANSSIVSTEKHFILKSPVFFKGEYRGDIFGWIEKDLIEHNFIASSHNPGSVTVLFSESGDIAAASKNDPEIFSIIKENIHLFKANLSKKDFSGLKMSIYEKGLIKFFGAKVSESEFYLVQVIPEKHFREQSPAVIIVSMLILLAGAVCGLFIWWRLNSKNLGLKIKVSEEITRKEIIKEKNKQLEEEIFKRKTAEKNLYEYNKNLESIVLKKTQNLEKALKRLKIAQSQLVQSEKMASIGQLSAGIAHEINNPLGFIKTNFASLQQYADETVRLLQEYENLESTDPEDFSKAVEKIHRIKKEMDFDFIKEDLQSIFSETKEGIERILSIITDLKFFAHKEKDEKVAVDIHQCIDSTLNVIHNEIKYKAEVVKDYSALPKIKCYPQRVNQIITNLIINAAQSIEKTGTITIRTYIENNYCVIKISDTGEGIPDHIKDKIFDPFFSTKPVGKGTGLGLHVVYDLVKKHDGKIKLESEVNKGTSFFIYLPLEKEE
jgi:signal transduction histidine kinase